MRTVSITEAKTHLSRLAADAADGEGFISTKNGRPLVKVRPADDVATSTSRRLGSMLGEIDVPDDFDTMGGGEIEAGFGTRC